MTLEELHEALKTFDWTNYTFDQINELEESIGSDRALMQVLKQAKHDFMAGNYQPDLSQEYILEPKPQPEDAPDGYTDETDT